MHWQHFQVSVEYTVGIRETNSLDFENVSLMPFLDLFLFFLPPSPAPPPVQSPELIFLFIDWFFFFLEKPHFKITFIKAERQRRRRCPKPSTIGRRRTVRGPAGVAEGLQLCPCSVASLCIMPGMWSLAIACGMRTSLWCYVKGVTGTCRLQSRDEFAGCSIQAAIQLWAKTSGFGPLVLKRVEWKRRFLVTSWGKA